MWKFHRPFDVRGVSIVRVISSPQCLDSGLRIRKEMSSTLYITLPAAAGVAEALPARTVWKAVTKRGSTDDGATGTLWAPRTTFTCGARAASRRIEAAEASRSVSGRYSQMGAG